jgi:hypothetical protein
MRSVSETTYGSGARCSTGKIPLLSEEMSVVEIVWAEACVCNITIVKFVFNAWPNLRVCCYFSRDKLEEILFLCCETWLNGALRRLIRTQILLVLQECLAEVVLLPSYSFPPTVLINNSQELTSVEV